MASGTSQTEFERLAVVTGANNGIGLETTLGIAKAGYRTIMACRSLDKANAARDEIIRKLPKAKLEILHLDVSDFASVRQFASEFRSSFDRLDVLINNAGILLYSNQSNSEGIELQFATNHLGHFLLTALLIDSIPDDPSSRIVHLSSLAHKGARVHFDDLTCGERGIVAYGQSKLACLLFGEELNRRLKAGGSSIRSVPVHPGGSGSGLFDEMSRAQYYFFKVLSPFILHSNKSAAKPSLYAALNAKAESGKFYGPQGFREFRGKVGEAFRDPSSKDLELAQRLWSLSEDLTRQSFKQI